MVNIESIESAKPLRGRPLLKQPMNPGRVLDVVRMREIEKKRWRQIANELGLSRQAPFLLHKKWKDWALDELYKKAS
jgi:hypothetical protein